MFFHHAPLFKATNKTTFPPYFMGFIDLLQRDSLLGFFMGRFDCLSTDILRTCSRFLDFKPIFSISVFMGAPQLGQLSTLALTSLDSNFSTPSTTKSVLHSSHLINAIVTPYLLHTGRSIIFIIFNYFNGTTLGGYFDFLLQA